MVTVDEISSVGMLAVAFAILISTIIQATSSKVQHISNFHAAVVLDLSWMNNTSTFIWFLLYAHHRSKGAKPIHATWTDCIQQILSSLRRNTELDGKRQRSIKEAIHYLQDLVSRAPVLTMGSIHLSLMASIGTWLWSNPSNFGAPIPCNPSLTIVGGSVSFSSPVLRILPLIMYSLLLIPGFNLIPGILFLLSLHISYNKCRNQHPLFWRRVQLVFGAMLHGLHPTFRWILKKPLPKRRYMVSPSDEESQSNSRSDNIHTSFLIVGLVCLAIINLLFLADIELTLSRNNQNQSRGENEWGFGQVPSLLLLVIPLRYFVTSVIRIHRENLREIKEEAISAVVKRLADSDWAVRRAALEGLSIFASRPQFHKVIRVAIPGVVECLADSDFYVRTAALERLLTSVSHSEFDDDVRVAIPAVVKCLVNSNSDVRTAAMKGLKIIVSHHHRDAPFYDGIRVAIPSIIENLAESHSKILRKTSTFRCGRPSIFFQRYTICDPVCV